MKPRLPVALWFAVLSLAWGTLGCGCGRPREYHRVVGSWLAEDSTVFTFRRDGTFVGRDYAGVRIWGQWTVLDERRVGFQSLCHKGFYQPQFAMLTSNGMEYAYSDSDHFVRSRRMSDRNAHDSIEKARPLPEPPP